jgi:NAD(P)-dependent dehydrogenase (short-subunit alcohol dehydrogenase family)
MSEGSGSLTGKTCVVTGATSGIGLAAAAALARLGARVIGVGRDAERSDTALRRVQAAAAESGAPPPCYKLADLSCLRETRALGEGLASGPGGIDALVNCAGVFTARRTLTPDGLETQFAVNHLAPFLLTTTLLSRLRAAPDGRVVVVSSASHRFGRIRWKDPSRVRMYTGLGAYGQSKLGNVLFVRELARRLGPGSSVTVFAADPGLVRTDMGLKHGPSLTSLGWRIRRRAGTVPEVPAAAVALLVASPELRGRTGLYWKDGRELAPSPRALDAQAARRLWDLSEGIIRQVLG